MYNYYINRNFKPRFNEVISYDFKVDMDIVLSSERLYFKRITEEEFESLYQMLKDPEVMYAWEHNFTEEDVHNWINKRCALYKLFGYDYFLAIDKSTNEVVGQIGLLDEPVNGEHFTGIGYILKIGEEKKRLL